MCLCIEGIGCDSWNKECLFKLFVSKCHDTLQLRTSQACQLWIFIQDEIGSPIDKDTIILDLESSVPDITMNIRVKEIVLIHARSRSEKLYLSGIANDNPASPVSWNFWNLGLKHLIKLVYPCRGCSFADHEEHSPILAFR
jgi:hypothetical protein